MATLYFHVLCLQTFESFSVLPFISQPTANPSINAFSLPLTYKIWSLLLLSPWSWAPAFLTWVTALTSYLVFLLVYYPTIYSSKGMFFLKFKQDHVCLLLNLVPPPTPVSSRTFRIMAELLLMLQGSVWCADFPPYTIVSFFPLLLPHPFPCWFLIPRTKQCSSLHHPFTCLLCLKHFPLIATSLAPCFPFDFSKVFRRSRPWPRDIEKSPQTHPEYSAFFFPFFIPLHIPYWLLSFCYAFYFFYLFTIRLPSLEIGQQLTVSFRLSTDPPPSRIEVLNFLI